MTPDTNVDTHFYRLEKALVGGRLIPVAGEDEATHVGIAALRRQLADSAHDRAALAEQAVQIASMGQRIRELDLLLARAMRRAEQADIMVAGHQAEMARCGASVRRLLAKNAGLIGEKRRLRDALTGKQPLPAVHYRVDLDHDDVARESMVVTLDAFPHKDRVPEALADARRVAARYGGRLRALRLDTTAWRAVVQYAGLQMGESFLKQEIEGPVPRQLDEAESWLVRNTLHAVELRGMDRIDRAEYPRSALREAVLNALAHRDYGQRGDRVRIYAFSDRVEVHSPGGLGGPMRLDNILEKRWSRNATLVQGLVALDIIEELGFGLDRMVAAMAEADLPAPVFANHGDTFVVTLYGHGHPSLLGSDVPRAEQESEREQEQHQRMSPMEREAWLLEHLRMKGPLSPHDYAAYVGIERRTAIRDLQALEARGLIEAQGTTKDRRYSLRREIQ